MTKISAVQHVRGLLQKCIRKALINQEQARHQCVWINDKISMNIYMVIGQAFKQFAREFDLIR